jgi:hypothetical protein
MPWVQAFKGVAQLRVVPAPGGAADGFKQIVQLELQLARNIVRAVIFHLHRTDAAQMRMSASQMVAMP